MALQIKIDQAGKPAGVTGFAREDLDLSVAVQLTATGGVAVTEYFWSFEYRPPNEAMTAPSAAVFTSLITNPTTFTPDNVGTYLIKLRVNQGSGLGATDDDVATITCYAGPALNADPTLLPRRRLSAKERMQHNVPDLIDPTGNRDGWAREWEKWFRNIEHLWSVVGGLGDHGTLAGLGDDDHSQYLLGARPVGGQIGYVATATGVGTFTWQAPAAVITDHGLLSGLGDDDHVDYLRGPRADGGGADLGKVPTAAADGTYTWQTPAAGVTDHGALTGLGDDDHSQYLLAARPANPGDDGKVLTASGGTGVWSSSSSIIGEVGWDATTGVIPDNFDADAIKLSIATATSLQNYSGAALNGVIGGTQNLEGFCVSITTSSSFSSYIVGSTITFTGTYNGGASKTDVLTITEGSGGETLYGDVLFDQITNIAVQEQNNTNGSIEFGVLMLGSTESIDFAPLVRTVADFSVIITVKLYACFMFYEGCDVSDFTAYCMAKIDQVSEVVTATAWGLGGSVRPRIVPHIVGGSSTLSSGERTLNIPGMDSSGLGSMLITDNIGSSLNTVDAYELRTKGIGSAKFGAYSGASETVVTTVTSAFDYMIKLYEQCEIKLTNSTSNLHITLNPSAAFPKPIYMHGFYKVIPARRTGVVVVG